MLAMHIYNLKHRIAVFAESLKRPLNLSHFGTGCISSSGHNSTDCAGDCPGLVGIIGKGQTHHKRAEIGKAETEGAEQMTVNSNWLVGIATVINQDFLSDDEDANRPFEALNVERAVLFLELHKVQGG